MALVRSTRFPLRPAAFRLGIAPAALLAIALPAAPAAAAGGGGATIVATPQAEANTMIVRKITCLSGCASITSAQPGATLRFQGPKLTKGKRSLTLTDFSIVLKKGAPTRIIAKAGAAKVPAFTLDAKKTKTTPDGLDTLVGPVGVELSATGASAIKTRRGVKLPKGYVLGKATVTLQSAATRVTLDSGTAGVLKQLGVSVAPESPAVAGSTIEFPITNAGGTLAAFITSP